MNGKCFSETRSATGRKSKNVDYYGYPEQIFGVKSFLVCKIFEVKVCHRTFRPDPRQQGVTLGRIQGLYRRSTADVHVSLGSSWHTQQRLCEIVQPKGRTPVSRPNVCRRSERIRDDKTIRPIRRDPCTRLARMSLISHGVEAHSSQSRNRQRDRNRERASESQVLSSRIRSERLQTLGRETGVRPFGCTLFHTTSAGYASYYPSRHGHQPRFFCTGVEYDLESRPAALDQF